MSRKLSRDRVEELQDRALALQQELATLQERLVEAERHAEEAEGALLAISKPLQKMVAGNRDFEQLIRYENFQCSFEAGCLVWFAIVITFLGFVGVFGESRVWLLWFLPAAGLARWLWTQGRPSEWRPE
jgi:hypothetical protein